MSRAELMDLGMRRIYEAGPREAFRSVADRFTGRVLEVGCGTGVLFADYPPGACVTAVDPDESLLPLARRYASNAPADISVLAGDVQRLIFPDNSFDAAVVQFVMCCVPDPARGLAEVVRVVRPGGMLYFYEHVIGRRWLYRVFQHVTAPVWCRMTEGCRWNRDTTRLIRSLPIRIETEEHFALRRGLMPPMPIVRITATRV